MAVDPSHEFKMASISAERVELLVNQLKNRMMLVTDETKRHLQSHGVMPIGVNPGILRADGCCKPDGGTCCVNKKVAFNEIGE